MRRDANDPGCEQRPQGRGRLLAVLGLLAALVPAGVRAQGSPPDSVTLTWTAPGDDGNTGTATAYDLRRSSAPISDSNWGSATVVPGTPVPLPAGSRQRMVVRGLTYGTTYYFAIKTVDDAGNWSNLSNVVRWNWVGDSAPPSAPTGLRGSRRGAGRVSLSWAPNPEADLAGYSVYRALSDGGPFTRLNATLLTAPQYEDATVPEAAEVVWYEVTATDTSGNESARSSTLALSLVEQTTTTWALEPGYPNPSRPGDVVTIPVVVPNAAGGAVLEIVNSAGQRVRRMELGPLAAGAAVARWDGRSDAGREAAPGIYTAWLIAGATRTSVRLVRVP